MKIYEMIFQKEAEEHTSIFYAENSQAARKNFIMLMREDIMNELERFKNQCLNDTQADLMDFMQEIYRESNFYIDMMENTFIDIGKAEFNAHISLIVEERMVRTI